MSKSSLSYPYDASSKADPTNKPEGDYHLLMAYRALQDAPSLADGKDIAERYKAADSHAKACLRLFASVHQQMRAYYVRGSAAIAQGRPAAGVRYLRKAMARAQSLSNRHAYAELNYLAAGASGQQLKFQDARGFAEECDIVLRTGATEKGSFDPVLDLANLGALIGYKFNLAEWEDIPAHLKQARELVMRATLATVTQHTSDANAIADAIEEQLAVFNWLEALTCRWSGELPKAFKLALMAAEVYGRRTSRVAQLRHGRLNGIVAEIALDLAETVDDMPSSTASRYLSMAAAYTRSALLIADELGDMAGVNLALLAEARFNGITHRNVSRSSVILNVLQNGRRLGDASIVAQAFTALGNDFDLLGEHDQALTCYRLTVESVKGTDIPALSVFARRLLNQQEWSR